MFVNEGNTKYIMMKQGISLKNEHQGLRCGTICFEKAKYIKYLGTVITNSNNIQIELVNRIRAENTCFYSITKLLTY